MMNKKCFLFERKKKKKKQNSRVQVQPVTGYINSHTDFKPESIIWIKHTQTCE